MLLELHLKKGNNVLTMLILLPFWYMLPAETWKLYGDAIWWALCTSFDVTIFNLLWVDLQWILLGSLSHIWWFCLQMPRYYVQVCFIYFFLKFLHKLKLMVLVANILVLQHILSKVYFFYLHLVCLWIILVEIYVESLIFCSNSQAELFSFFIFIFIIMLLLCISILK